MSSESLDFVPERSSLDSFKNNSNGEIEDGERIDRIISEHEITFVAASGINRKWVARDKIKIAQWYLKNYALNLHERDELRKIIEEDLKSQYQEDLFSIKSKTSETLQHFFRQIEQYKQLEARVQEVEFEKLNLVEYAESEFKEYTAQTHKRWRVMRAASPEAGSGMFLGRLQHRFSPSYSKKVRAALNPLLYDKRYAKGGVFLTLTLNPKKYKSRYEMWKSIKSEENRFLTRLFKETGRIPYLSVTEAQKNGNPHLHLLFFGVSRLLDWREIQDMWGLGHVWINKTAKDERIRNPLAYMYKYITKAVDTRNKKNNTTQALLWLFHVRSYSVSRNLIKPLNDVTSGDVELLGLLSSNGRSIVVVQTNLTEIVSHLMKIADGDPPPGADDQ